MIRQTRRPRTAPATAAAALALLTLLAVHGAAAAQPFQYQWRVADLAAADGDVVELGTRRGAPLATLRTEQIRLLYAISRALESVAELGIELIVVDGTQPNAFAGKGKRGENIVGINFAMLELLDMDAHAAAALLGHEIAHLKLAHGEQRAASAATTGILSVLSGVVLGSMGVPGGRMLSDLTFAAIQSNYSRDNEREADYLGAIWAVEAGFEPEGAVRLHEALQRKSTGGAPMPFLSSHPSGPERIATLKSLSARLSRAAPQR